MASQVSLPQQSPLMITHTQNKIEQEENLKLLSMTDLNRKNSLPLNAIRRNKSIGDGKLSLPFPLYILILLVENFFKKNVALKEVERKANELLSEPHQNHSIITNSSLDISKAFEADISLSREEQGERRINESRKKENHDEEGRKEEEEGGLLHEKRGTERKREGTEYLGRMIVPLSRFYMIWHRVVIFAFAYNLLWTPFALCFRQNFTNAYILIDLVFVMIYLADIVITAMTTFKLGYIKLNKNWG